MAVDITDRGAAVDDVGAVGLRVDVLAQVEHLGGEVANDLFENIFQRYQTDHITIFVNHNGDTALLLLKIEQLGVQGRAFRDEIRLLAGTDQGFPGQLAAAQQARDGAHVHDAGDIVDVALIERQPGVVAGPQLMDDSGQVVIQVDADSLVARDHDVVDRHLFQIEDAEQHILAAAGNAQASFAHYGA